MCCVILYFNWVIFFLIGIFFSFKKYMFLFKNPFLSLALKIKQVEQF